MEASYDFLDTHGYSDTAELSPNLSDRPCEKSIIESKVKLFSIQSFDLIDEE